MSGCCCQSVKISVPLVGERSSGLDLGQSLQNLVEALILRVGPNFRRNISVAEASAHDSFSDNTSRQYASRTGGRSCCVQYRETSRLKLWRDYVSKQDKESTNGEEMACVRLDYAWPSMNTRRRANSQLPSALRSSSS